MSLVLHPFGEVLPYIDVAAREKLGLTQYLILVRILLETNSDRLESSDLRRCVNIVTLYSMVDVGLRYVSLHLVTV